MKLNLTAILLSVSIACTGCAKPVAKKDPFNGIPPEQLLAKIDGETDFKPYTELLNELEGKCVESRQDIGVMVNAIVRAEAKAGNKISNMDSLETFIAMTDPTTQERDSCFKIYGELFKSARGK